MIPPGALVMLTPVVVGVLFGTRTLAGVLAGSLVSGVQVAISMSNTGSAWDNAKKYVEVSLCLLQLLMRCFLDHSCVWCCIWIIATRSFPVLRPTLSCLSSRFN